MSVPPLSFRQQYEYTLQNSVPVGSTPTEDTMSYVPPSHEYGPHRMYASVSKTTLVSALVDNASLVVPTSASNVYSINGLSAPPVPLPEMENPSSFPNAVYPTKNASTTTTSKVHVKVRAITWERNTFFFFEREYPPRFLSNCKT